MTDSLVIPSRFCGPPGSGNGGYVCGRIAAYVDGPVTVTLRRPPPLATPMAVERGASFDGHGCGQRRWPAQRDCHRAIDVRGDPSADVAAVAAARGAAEAGRDDQGICHADPSSLFTAAVPAMA